MWRVHKAGCADPCGLEGQGGAEAAAIGWWDRLAAASGLSVGDQDQEQTFQDQVKLLQLRVSLSILILTSQERWHSTGPAIYIYFFC